MLSLGKRTRTLATEPSKSCSGDCQRELGMLLRCHLRRGVDFEFLGLLPRQ